MLVGCASRGWVRRFGLRSLAVRACTQDRFTELMHRDKYAPGTVGSGPPGTKELAWYESDSGMGCVVDTEAGNVGYPADYWCMLYDKSSDGVMPELGDMITSVSDLHQAKEMLAQRLAANEKTLP